MISVISNGVSPQDHCYAKMRSGRWRLLKSLHFGVSHHLNQHYKTRKPTRMFTRSSFFPLQMLSHIIVVTEAHARIDCQEPFTEAVLLVSPIIPRQINHLSFRTPREYVLATSNRPPLSHSTTLSPRSVVNFRGPLW